MREVDRTETLRFRTGSGTSALAAPPDPTIQAHHEAPTNDAGQDCLLLTERCSDTGDGTCLSFEIAAVTSPLFWILEGILPGREPSSTPVSAMFPGSCRSPWVHVHAGYNASVRVHAVQADGTSTHSDTYCTSESAADAGSSTSLPASHGSPDAALQSPDATPLSAESPQPISDKDEAARAAASGSSAAGVGSPVNLWLVLAALLVTRRRSGSHRT